MSSAITLLGQAYRDHNLDIPTTFDTSLEFPLNIAKQIINEVIRDLNRLGNFWFSETKTALAYSGGVYQYDLGALVVNPRRIKYVRRDADGFAGELTAMEYQQMQRTYRTTTAISSGVPNAYAIFNASLELNYVPDQDYSIYVYHYKDMQPVTATTDSQSNGVILIPDEYEDLLQIGCYLYLGYKIGKFGYEKALTDLSAKAQPFLIVTRSNSGLPQQFPAAF